jgi:hypothetical protein
MVIASAPALAPLARPQGARLGRESAKNHGRELYFQHLQTEADLTAAAAGER